VTAARAERSSARPQDSERCVHVGCGSKQRSRRLCERHYQQLKRSGLGPLQRKQPARASGVQLWAQEGRNPDCVDCGDRPLFGGLRCLPCFQLRCDERSIYRARIGVGG